MSLYWELFEIILSIGIIVGCRRSCAVIGAWDYCAVIAREPASDVA